MTANDLILDVALLMLQRLPSISCDDLTKELEARAVKSGPVLMTIYDEALEMVHSLTYPNGVCYGEAQIAGDTWHNDAQVAAFVAARFGVLTISEIHCELLCVFAPERVPSKVQIRRYFMRVGNFVLKLENDL